MHVGIRKLAAHLGADMRQFRQPVRRRARQGRQVACRARQHARAVNPVLLVKRHEELGSGIGRFGRTEEQETVRFQCQMEHFQHPQLHVTAEVDQQIAARDHVQLGERRIAQQIVRGEQDAVAQGFADAAAVVFLGEELAQPRWRHIHHDGSRIGAGARHRDRIIVDIGSKQLDIGRFGQRGRMIGQQHRQRIRFLAAGAGRHPYADLLTLRLVAEQLRHHTVFQRLERIAVAEEIGHADQQILEQGLELQRLAFQQVGIVAQRGHALHQQAALDPPQYRGALVVTEIVTGIGAQHRNHALQSFLAGGHLAGFFAFAQRFVRRIIGVDQLDVACDFTQGNQLGGNLLRAQHEVDHIGGDGGQRHAIMFAFARVLRHRHAAQLLDVFQAIGAVAAGAGQHHRHRAFTVRLGQGAEEYIDGDVGATWPFNAGKPPAEAPSPTTGKPRLLRAGWAGRSFSEVALGLPEVIVDAWVGSEQGV